MFDDIADEIIKQELETHFPTQSYLTEETGMVDKGSEELWIIDPLDGTGNYVNSNPFFAVSIALWKNNEPVLCIIEAPELGERYIAERGKGAQMIKINSKKIITTTISTTTTLAQAYLVYCEGGVVNRNEVLPLLINNFPQVKDMRKLGSAALELAWVGTGRADAYLTQDISLWDIAAGVLFVTESGGKITDLKNQPLSWQDIAKNKEVSLIASNGHLKLST